MLDNQRRAADGKEQHDIEKMIEAENDPKIRLQLIVLNRINLSLIANTRTTDDIADKLESHITAFDTHRKTEEALLNKGRGAWLVAVWVLGAIQLLSITIWSDASSEMTAVKEAITSGTVKVAQLDTRVGVLEKVVAKLP